MSVLDVILPAHTRIVRVVEQERAEGAEKVARAEAPPLTPLPPVHFPALVGNPELADTLVALIDMIAEEDWITVQRLAEHVAHQAKLKRYQQTLSQEGVVRR